MWASVVASNNSNSKTILCATKTSISQNCRSCLFEVKIKHHRREAIETYEQVTFHNNFPMLPTNLFLTSLKSIALNLRYCEAAFGRSYPNRVIKTVAKR